MDNTKPTIEDLKQALSGTSPEEIESPEETVADVAVVEEDDSAPLKAELEKLKSKKTPAEKAKESLYFNAQKAIELGVDITKDEGLKKILGISKTSREEEEEPVSEDDKPVTKKELQDYLRKLNAQKNSEQLADEIPDEYERELVKYHLANTIKSTGDAKEDLQIARTLANSVRNKKFEELANIKPAAKSHSSASGATTEVKAPEVELTSEEKQFLATGKITKEEILALRQVKKI